MGIEQVLEPVSSIREMIENIGDEAVFVRRNVHCIVVFFKETARLFYQLPVRDLTPRYNGFVDL